MLLLSLAVDLDLCWLLAILIDLFFLIHLFSFPLHFNYPQIPSRSRLDHQKVFFGLRTVGIVDNESARKAGFQGCRSDHFELMLAIGVELEHCPGSNAQTLIEGLKEFADTLKRVVVFTAGHTQPLDC